MTPAQALKFIPSPFIQHVWYPTDGKWEVCRTRGKGKNSRKWYIKVRCPIKYDLVSPDGTLLEKDYSTGWHIFQSEMGKDWMPLSWGRNGKLWRFPDLNEDGYREKEA